MLPEEKVFAWAAERGYSDADIASRCALGTDMVSKMRSFLAGETTGGRRIYAVKHALSTAQAMGVTVEYLFDHDADWPPPLHHGGLSSLSKNALVTIETIVEAIGEQAVIRRLLRADDGPTLTQRRPSPGTSVRVNGGEDQGGAAAKAAR